MATWFHARLFLPVGVSLAALLSSGFFKCAGCHRLEKRQLAASSRRQFGGFPSGKTRRHSSALVSVQSRVHSNGERHGHAKGAFLNTKAHGAKRITEPGSKEPYDNDNDDVDDDDDDIVPAHKGAAAMGGSNCMTTNETVDGPLGCSMKGCPCAWYQECYPRAVLVDDLKRNKVNANIIIARGDKVYSRTGVCSLGARTMAAISFAIICSALCTLVQVRAWLMKGREVRDLEDWIAMRHRQIQTRRAAAAAAPQRQPEQVRPKPKVAMRSSSPPTAAAKTSGRAARAVPRTPSPLPRQNKDSNPETAPEPVTD
eukprot:TRINITY_DN3431_c0_g1_i1.p1 TRINITY_DN3431_c0_g1~~TRINITY_DN3431_c0_g1_i1.p1  ORF type:complete len:313 (+),score=32.73 TRINITY_DN3431_c0_g1_i1:224-1162(+)